MTFAPDRCHAPACAAPSVMQAASRTTRPSWLDRELERVGQVLPALGRASEGMLASLTVLFIASDVLVWATDPDVDHGRLPFSIAITVPLLGLVSLVVLSTRRAHRTRSMAVLAGASIGLTLATIAIGTGLPPSSAAPFVLAVLTAEALRFEPGGRAVALTALSGVTMAAEAVRPMVPTVGYLLAVFAVAFAVEVALGVYLRWIDWRRAATAEWARNAERLEIARELHDLVGHHVTGIVVQAQAARHVAERRPDALVHTLVDIERAGSVAMEAMRRMVGGLRADHATAPAGSWDEVDRRLAEAMQQGLPLRADIDPVLHDEAPSLAPAVLRIVTESLTNVRRHARRVGRVDVVVRHDGDRVVVAVTDDGEPVGAGAHDAFGIVGMRERAESLGGSLTAGPIVTGGWSVRAELPVPPVRPVPPEPVR